MNRLYTTCFLLTLLCACNTTHKAYIQNKEHRANIPELPHGHLEQRLFLVGDAGGLDNYEDGTNSVFEQVKKHIASEETPTSLFFLGDNIYEHGLASKEDPDRLRQEKILDAHLALAELCNEDSYFIPGNHDWNNNSPGGREAVIRQGNYVNTSKYNRDNINFHPNNACGDPKVVKISNDLVYVFLDMQWWVHDWSLEKDINKDCKVKSRREYLDKVKEILIKHKNDRILIALHHPIKSNGKHGGHFGLKDHLFPLTKVDKRLLLPLPFIGSAYPVYRQLGGSNQDITFAGLQSFKKEVEHVIRIFDVSRVTFISGHDHHLQHSQEQFIFQKFPINYIVSGTGYKTNNAATKQGASFVRSARGYGILNFYEDGRTWLEFYTVSKDGKNRILEYRTEIYKSDPTRIVSKNKDSKIEKSSEGKKMITQAPNEKFGKGSVYKAIMGKLYRPSWTIPVQTEIFELGKYHDGLRPIKKGGGLFTHTLRLEDNTKKQYVLRSINKDFYKAVPKNIQHLELLKLYEDQSAASIPYGALYIAALSDYAEVYHADPQLVFLDDPSQLGPFASYFPKGHYLLEARPDGDWEGTDLFGNSDKIIGYTDLIYKLRTKDKHFVDQKWALKSRLFDMFIHDRDRHDDQWRWASFKEDEKTYYRPVPRDRDWAFFKYGGMIPSVMGNVVDAKLKTMKPNSIDIKSLATNANNFDRYFLNDLTWTDWEEAIDNLLSKMTDDAIENSLESLPNESRSYISSELVNKLKSRRVIFKEEVKKYYDFISEEIEFIGSDEKDIFNIDIQSNGDILLKIFRDSKKNGKIEKHSRTIYASETKELRIYGLAGKDIFRIKSEGDTDIKIRLIGGIGDDIVEYTGDNKINKNIIIYDDKEGMKTEDALIVKDKRTDKDLQINEYNRLGYLYHTGLPWLNLGVAPDEGLTFGVGFQTIKHGWRKSPNKSSHLFNSQFTVGQRLSLDIKYEGEYPNLFAKGLGLAPSFRIEVPDNINFFGFGENEYNRGVRSSDNWVQLSSFTLNSHMIYRAGSGGLRIRFGPSYESFKIEENTDVVNVLNVLNVVEENETPRDHFVGFHTDIKLSTTDRIDKPSRGILMKALVKHQYEIGEQNNTLKYGLNFAWYTSLFYHADVVFASNTGFQSILGDPLFYLYPAMGNKEFLRPYRNERFRGETILYQQVDVRIGLFNWNNSILPLGIGAIAGYDLGQVYFQREDTGSIKHGWTLGLSYDLVGYFIVRTSLSGSSEGKYFKFEVGYAF